MKDILGKRSELLWVVSSIRVEVCTQREPDGTWVARFGNHRPCSAPTQEEAVRLACEAASCTPIE